MKRSHLTVYRPDAPICPNGADNQFFAQRAVNILTGVASGIGFLSALAFLLTMR